MNKRFSFQLSRLIYSIAAALLLTAESASATADGPDFYQVTGVANGDVLNIRSHPNPHAEKLGEIPPDGTCLRNLGCQGGLTFQEFTELSKARQAARLKENPRWCRIEYQGVTGWVAGRYLQEGTCDSMATGRAPDLREPGSDSFQTVCGVIIDRKTHSYLCTVTEIKGNKGIERTALRFPDQEIQLVWGKGKQVDVLFEGLTSATPATYSTDEERLISSSRTKPISTTRIVAWRQRRSSTSSPESKSRLPKLPPTRWILLKHTEEDRYEQ